jgi:hypothetical protein
MAVQRILLMTSGTASSRSAYLEDAVYIRTGASPCRVKIASDGFVYAQEGSSYTSRYSWLTGGGTGADYEVYCTELSGNLGGTLDTWEALSTDRIWEVIAPSMNIVTGEGFFEIRDASTHSIIASATLWLECDRT